jgi:hypothetical protein
MVKIRPNQMGGDFAMCPEKFNTNLVELILAIRRSAKSVLAYWVVSPVRISQPACVKSED